MSDQVIPVAAGFALLIFAALVLSAMFRARRRRIRERRKRHRDEENQQIYDDWNAAESRREDGRGQEFRS